MTREPRWIDIDAASFDTLPCCGIKSAAHPGRRQKRCWLDANALCGLRAKALLTPDGQSAGYIEYIPGEFAWRGVDARGCLFIQCIWLHAKRHQGKGWASLMVRACIEDAKRAGLRGAAVLVRDGPWLAGSRLYLANGFEPVDAAPPDYRLLVYKFNRKSANPSLPRDWEARLAPYRDGLTIIRSSQCPYTAKFAVEIAECAEREYHVRPKVVDLHCCGMPKARPRPTPPSP
ncbi:MAG TPA: GNAT family N-acetyltransferase [Bryobacteraceae bacterium]